MTKQQGGGFVIRDSHKKEKVTIQEEKRRQRLRKREKKNRDRKGEVDCKALSKNISHHHHQPRCYSVLLCMLAEQAFTSTSSFALQYHLSEWDSKFKDIWNVWHSFSTTSLQIWFCNHCINGFLMTARSERVIGNIHHSGAICSGQDVNPWEASCPLVIMLYHRILAKLLGNCNPTVVEGSTLN